MKERFDYGQNPDKTEGGELISSYGCDHMTADAEFLLSKAKYKAATGREQRRDADVLCYQIRQSFKPGEITPPRPCLTCMPAVSMRRRKSAKSSGRSVRAVSMAKRICSFCESF